MPDETTPTEEQAAAEPLETGGPAPKAAVPASVAWMTFVLVALLGFLIAMLLRNGPLHPSPGNPEVAALQAQLDALSIGQGDAEPAEVISDRMKKDVDSLVGRAADYQKLLVEMESQLAARTAEALRAEQARQSLAAELTAARRKLDAMSAGVPAEDHADLKRRLDETLRAKEFFEARAKALETDAAK